MEGILGRLLRVMRRSVWGPKEFVKSLEWVGRLLMADSTSWRIDHWIISPALLTMLGDFDGIQTLGKARRYVSLAFIL